MPRPRTPSNVLAIKGAYRRHPDRARHDVTGNKALSRRPPADLPEVCHPAWRQIVGVLPKGTAYDADTFVVQTASVLLTRWRQGGDLKDARELRLWLIELGLSPRSRAYVAAPTPPKDARRDHEDPMDEFTR